jgi:hypothetical protein
VLVNNGTHKKQHIADHVLGIFVGRIEDCFLIRFYVDGNCTELDDPVRLTESGDILHACVSLEEDHEGDKEDNEGDKEDNEGDKEDNEGDNVDFETMLKRVPSLKRELLDIVVKFRLGQVDLKYVKRMIHESAATTSFKEFLLRGLSVIVEDRKMLLKKSRDAAKQAARDQRRAARDQRRAAETAAQEKMQVNKIEAYITRAARTVAMAAVDSVIHKARAEDRQREDTLRAKFIAVARLNAEAATKRSMADARTEERKKQEAEEAQKARVEADMQAKKAAELEKRRLWKAAALPKVPPKPTKPTKPTKPLEILPKPRPQLQPNPHLNAAKATNKVTVTLHEYLERESDKNEKVSGNDTCAEKVVVDNVTSSLGVVCKGDSTETIAEHKTKSTVECIVCFADTKETSTGFSALISCGHVFCTQCSQSLQVCPVCSAGVTGSIRIFF